MVGNSWQKFNKSFLEMIQSFWKRKIILFQSCFKILPKSVPPSLVKQVENLFTRLMNCRKHRLLSCCTFTLGETVQQLGDVEPRDSEGCKETAQNLGIVLFFWGEPCDRFISKSPCFVLMLLEYCEVLAFGCVWCECSEDESLHPCLENICASCM